MTNDKILASVAEDFGLDPEEARIALLYAAASKEATQRALTATPAEATRLKGMKRLSSLTLDLYQRLKVAATLPRFLVDERQADLASQLSGTSREVRKLEETLFGEPRTLKDPLVTKAEAQRKTYGRHKLMPETMPETPTPPRRAMWSFSAHRATAH